MRTGPSIATACPWYDPRALIFDMMAMFDHRGVRLRLGAVSPPSVPLRAFDTTRVWVFDPPGVRFRFETTYPPSIAALRPQSHPHMPNFDARSRFWALPHASVRPPGPRFRLLALDTTHACPISARACLFDPKACVFDSIGRPRIDSDSTSPMRPCGAYFRRHASFLDPRASVRRLGP